MVREFTERKLREDCRFRPYCHVDWLISSHTVPEITTIIVYAGCVPTCRRRRLREMSGIVGVQGEFPAHLLKRMTDCVVHCIAGTVRPGVDRAPIAECL